MKTETIPTPDEIVNAWIESGNNSIPDDQTMEAALFLFRYQPLHKCYWNNRFAIAVMCRLPNELQRLAAFAMLVNGRTGYFEWITHAGYKMIDVFRLLKIKTDHIPRYEYQRSDYPGYSHIDTNISIQICEMYRLNKMPKEEIEGLLKEMGQYQCI